MREEDIQSLKTLRDTSPKNWRLTSLYYDILRKYGIPWSMDDDVRDSFVDAELERMESK